MSPKLKQKKPNEEESEDSYSSDSSDGNEEGYTGNEVKCQSQFIIIFFLVNSDTRFVS